MTALFAGVKKATITQKPDQEGKLARHLEIVLTAELPEGDDGKDLVAAIAEMQEETAVSVRFDRFEPTGTMELQPELTEPALEGESEL